MKKCLTIILSMIMVLSMSVVFATESDVFATEAATDVQAKDVSATGIPATGVPATGTDLINDESNKLAGYATAKVTKVSAVSEQSYYDIYTIKTQEVTIDFMNGEYKDQEFDTVYYISQDYFGMYESPELSVGDKVYADVQITEPTEDGGETTYNASIVQKIRDTHMLITGLIIAVLLIVITRFVGLRIIGLMATNALVVFGAVFGLYMTGVNPILSLLILMASLILVNGVILNGFKKETFVAMLAALVATTISMGVITLLNNIYGVVGLTEYGSYITGVADASTLLFSYLDIIVAGIIVIITGLTMDIALRSVKKASQGRDFVTTVKDISSALTSRMNIAFMVLLGTFMPVFIVFTLFNRPIMEIINVETITIEIIKLLIIVLNVVIVIPISVLLSKELLKVRGLSENVDEKEEQK